MSKKDDLAAAVAGTMLPLVAPLPPATLAYAADVAKGFLAPETLVPPAVGLSGPLVGPQLAAASIGILPSPSDAVKCQVHIDLAGLIWIFNGTAWKQVVTLP